MHAALAAAFLGATLAHGASPALDYALECQGCHRADGAGTPGSIPALAGSVGRFTRVPGGREYLVRVPGVAQAPLDDARLAAVLDWMLARFGGADVAPDFPPYGAAEVGHLRAAPLVDVEETRRRLLGALGQADAVR